MQNGGDSTTTLGGKEHENTQEYISGLLAAIRTHQRLTGGKPLTVEVQRRARIPLAQTILLR